MRDLRGNPGEKVIGGLELPVHVRQAPIELSLFLLQQGHVIGLLLQAASCVALLGDIEQHDPNGVAILMKMKVGGAAAVELDRGNEIGRLDER